MTSSQPFFYGDGRPGENPQDYMKTTKRRFFGKVLTDEAKVEELGLGMASGMEGEAWFDELDAGTTASWMLTVAAFDRRWPKVAVVAKTREQKVAELRAHKLKEVDVGRMIDNGRNSEEMGHVVYAKRMLELANAIPDTNALLIGTTLEQLPTIVQDLIDETYTSWDEFHTAIKTLSVAKFKRRTVERDEITKRVQDSPTKAIRTALERVGINPTMRAQHKAPSTYPQAYSNPNPFQAREPMRPSNLFAPRPTVANPSAAAQGIPRQFRPDIDRLRDALKNAPVHHPATTEGFAAHAAQVTEWKATHGLFQSESHPFPLKPGTGPAHSNECFTCGRSDHPGLFGPSNCPNAPLDPLEQRWRSIASSMRRGADRATSATSVNLVSTSSTLTPASHLYPDTYHQYYDFPVYNSAEYDDQGKGQGSSA